MKKYAVLFFVLFLAVGFAQNENNKQDNSSVQMSGGNIISVTIGGKFIAIGTFPANINERVDQFITRIYNQALLRYNGTTNPEYYTFRDITLKPSDYYTLRGITIKHADGKEQKIDLVKFHINGDFVNNPYLKNDDVIIFSQADIDRNFFKVTGAVNNPGNFYFIDGDKLKDAIELTGGINKAYDNVVKANIYRLSYDGTEEKVISVDVNSDFAIQRGDRIVVIADETMKKDFNARVIGEVNNPGWIPITKNTTTLYDVIKMAGGMTASASPRFAKVYTGNSFYSLLEKQFDHKVKNLEFKSDKELGDLLFDLEELNMERMSRLVAEDTSYFKAESRLRIMAEHLSVDFTQLNDPNSEASKYIIKDNDLIIIPAIDKTVYVFGQVPAHGHIEYVKGADYKYYIKQAGGYGDFAEQGDVMVIKGDTRNWIQADKNPVIEEGDYIYVPRNYARSFNSYVAEVGVYLGIVGSVATIILLLLQFTK